MKTISHLCFALSVSQGADIYKSKENIEKNNMLAKDVIKCLSLYLSAFYWIFISEIFCIFSCQVSTSADINNNNAANIPQGFPVSYKRLANVAMNNFESLF